MRIQRTQLLLPLFERAKAAEEEEEPEYDPESHYISVQLNDKSRQRLLNRVPGHFQNVQGHHVTLVAKPTEDDIARYRKLVGKQVNFHATHHASSPDMGVQAVRVRGLEQYSDKPNHHITISTAPGVPAHMSNNLLDKEQGKNLGRWHRMTGTFQITPRTGRIA